MYKIDRQQDIWYSTGNYSLYLEITFNSVYLNQYAIYLKLIKYCQSTSLQKFD